MKSLDQVFWSNYTVKENGCWEWNGPHNHQGYGVFYPMDGSKKCTAGVVAHRISCFLTCDDFDNELIVMHKCDNPPCINPEHLKQGTTMDNVRDKIAKGRARYLKGSELSTSKLNPWMVRVIRRVYEFGTVRQHELAELFKVKTNTISRAISGITWSEVSHG